MGFRPAEQRSAESDTHDVERHVECPSDAERCFGFWLLRDPKLEPVIVTVTPSPAGGRLCGATPDTRGDPDSPASEMVLPA